MLAGSKTVCVSTRQLPSSAKGSSELDTSDTSWWPETCFILEGHGVNRWRIKQQQQQKRKIKFRGEYYQPGKGSVLTWKPYFSPTPSLKILTGPWHSESADTNLPWFRSDPDRILKSQRCPLLNHILTIHWGRLCWEKKSLPHIHLFIFLWKKKNFFTCSPFLMKVIFYSDFYILK